MDDLYRERRDEDFEEPLIYTEKEEMRASTNRGTTTMADLYRESRDGEFDESLHDDH
ncbi:GlxA family transcriptional regulator [Sesbania bispinosa]|nr:GlxA family transcriptional regulator [Sesbania bispinosa]